MSDCFCDTGDYDAPVFYRRADVLMARDIHKCYECGHAILPGESYESVHALWDRYEGPQTIHTCAWCMDLREWITASVPCFCFLHGYLLEGTEETVDNYAHETTGLRFGFLRRKAVIDKRPLFREALAA